MHFKFLITRTREVVEGTILYDLNEIEDFVNKKLSDQDFGKSIDKFHLGYEIFDFNGRFAHFLSSSATFRRYGNKNKYLLVVKQFDYDTHKQLNKSAQFEELRNKILEAIDDTKYLKRQPKDFDRAKFISALTDILTEYSNTHCT